MEEGPSPYLTVSADVDEDEDEAKDGTEEGDRHASSVHLQRTGTTHCNNCGQQLSSLIAEPFLVIQLYTLSGFIQKIDNNIQEIFFSLANFPGIYKDCD